MNKKYIFLIYAHTLLWGNYSKAPSYNFDQIVSSKDRNDFFKTARYGKPKDLKKYARRKVKTATILGMTISGTARSALHHAAAYGNKETVEYILKHLHNEKDINKKDFYDRSPLYEAIVHGHFDVADILKNHGASLRFGHKKFYTLRFLSRQRGNQEHRDAMDRYLLSHHEDTECDICCEEFNDERQKVVIDDQCLKVICCFCKARSDKCPFCRTKFE